MPVHIQQPNGTWKVIPARDYEKTPLTPEEQKTRDAFKRSVEKSPGAIKLKEALDRLDRQQAEAKVRQERLRIEAEKEQAEENARTTKKVLLYLLFFPITIPLTFVFLFVFIIWSFVEDWQDSKETKIRLEKDRQRLLALGYRDDQIYTFNE